MEGRIYRKVLTLILKELTDYTGGAEYHQK